MIQTYDVQIDATITVRVQTTHVDYPEHDAEEQAMAILDVLETHTIKIGDLTCTETTLVHPDDVAAWGKAILAGADPSTPWPKSKPEPMGDEFFEFDVRNDPEHDA